MVWGILVVLTVPMLHLFKVRPILLWKSRLFTLWISKAKVSPGWASLIKIHLDEQCVVTGNRTPTFLTASLSSSNWATRLWDLWLVKKVEQNKLRYNHTLAISYNISLEIKGLNFTFHLVQICFIPYFSISVDQRRSVAFSTVLFQVNLNLILFLVMFKQASSVLTITNSSDMCFHNP